MKTSTKTPSSKARRKGKKITARVVNAVRRSILTAEKVVWKDLIDVHKIGVGSLNKIMKQLEAVGVVGPGGKGKARQVLLNADGTKKAGAAASAVPVTSQVVDAAIMNGGNGKIPVRQFIESAIIRLRVPGHKGIHTVWSGFNKIFLEYYGVPSRAYVDQLTSENFLLKVIVKGGPIVNLVNEAPGAAPAEPSVLAMSPELKKVLEAATQK